MSNRWRLADAFTVLFLAAAFTHAQPEGVKCEVDRDAVPPRIEIRDQPGSSAIVLGTVQSDAADFRELDIATRGPRNNDWIKVQAGEVVGWVNAAGFQCRLSPEEARAEISSQADRVIQALKRKDMNALAAYVHPVKGVRFSPSATVGWKGHVQLMAPAVRQLLKDPTRRTWGVNDGSGTPIRLSSAEYYAKFIYSRDFAKAPFIGFNAFEAKPSDRDNLWEVYPNALVVEYYFPPTLPDGNDWAGLRLVYEKNDGRWFLSGIIHIQWTI